MIKSNPTTVIREYKLANSHILKISQNHKIKRLKFEIIKVRPFRKVYLDTNEKDDLHTVYYEYTLIKCIKGIYTKEISQIIPSIPQKLITKTLKKELLCLNYD